jgi:hypothetical protein
VIYITHVKYQNVALFTSRAWYNLSMKYILPVVIIMAFIVLAACPWFTATEAMQIVEMRSAQLQQMHDDLCAQTIFRNTIRRVPFGYIEQVSYDCTVTDRNFGILKDKNTVFITFYKQLIGMPDKRVATKNL